MEHTILPKFTERPFLPKFTKRPIFSKFAERPYLHNLRNDSPLIQISLTDAPGVMYSCPILNLGVFSFIFLYFIVILTLFNNIFMHY